MMDLASTPQPRLGVALRAGAFCALAYLSSCSPDSPPEEAHEFPEARTVVLVTIDTLRADFVSYSGRGEITTPYLDSLAEGGVIIKNAYAPSSLTAPSMASLITGVYPTTHGIHTGLFAGGPAVGIEKKVVPGDLVTLAESFQQAGYVTIGVPSNKNLTEELGFGQGFDFYLDEAPFMDAPFVNEKVREQLELAFGPEWKTKWKQEKTFLWIHYFDPHVPYRAREPWIRDYAPDFAENPSRYPANLPAPAMRRRLPDDDPERAEKITPLYSSEIRFLDDRFERLASELGLAEPDVALIVTSDHGEEFFEHGKLNHGKSLFEEVVRVPMFARWPEGLPSARAVDDAVSLLDVYPTLLDMCGIEPPSGLQGVSFAPLLLEPLSPETAPSSSRPLIFEQAITNAQCSLAAVIVGEWKLIRTLGVEESLQLYNLQQDPTESNDLAASQPERVQKLESLLQRVMERLPDSAELSSTWTDDPELRKELQDLGYTGE